MGMNQAWPSVTPNPNLSVFPRSPQTRRPANAMASLRTFILLLAFLSFPALMFPFLLCAVTQLSQSAVVGLDKKVQKSHCQRSLCVNTGFCRYLKLQASQSLNFYCT